MSKEIVRPSILPGFMELLPQDQILFNKILEKIQKVYERYGFIPIDTPVIEKSEVLLAKGGGETEKQVYRFNKGSSDLSLRFDLTVPLARYVAEHMSDLTFPFRRYQIGKVYRGERNQKGRFREFYQCDIDIIGNGKLNIINDAEIPSIICSIFNEIGLKEFKIHINNRKIMNGVFEHFEVLNKVEALRIVDKIDKIGIEAVEVELEKIDISADNIKGIIEFINIKGTNDEILNSLKELEISNDSYTEGVEELSKVIHYMRCFGVSDKNFIIDLKITRGLDYYTGTVFETMLDEYPQIGSVCSGGRYDNLAEYYTKEKLPGVGISIGLTRLFYQLKEAGIIESKGVSTLTEVLVIPVDDSLDYCINVASKLREKEIISEVYFEEGKIAKKLNYANKLGISNVILIGNDEAKSGILTLKDMSAGNQYKLTIDEIIEKIKF
ncbi:histidine--tRNA ligase [Clostridium argentinense CDC 2741]|uniref:Histidine--tRNA ligase n=1 Tax=Clostridium argentinense CDC 2741 TaxID=1418104 RepID=A0A0C1UCS0_9CLOT|nr:histidine--tRNA ligase [Clostridium argentinense]ARC86770.1 histidine--tRNA ligase [Clostridium argentinense]KIE45320.1 histidine--tRNA ligase [Clostridium argentinense CDC 2741]NFF38516.1 histidine--tRNA ligase [Clostridium argentinense]NFP49291.1 histidine--tRNA ligase [Clostridium argentinense]NFP71694.1 histidine--tRNA ligase [Clostridium argentinense]